MSTPPKPPTTMTPELTRVLAVAMPLVQAFAAEISKLPPEVQLRRIAKVLEAMRDESTDLPILDLKLPPSVNQLWRTGRGKVFRSSTYDAWRKEAGWELLAQRPGRVEGPVHVTISAGKPDDGRKRDLDNIAGGKAVLDLLVAHRVIEDDSKVTSITSSSTAMISSTAIASATCNFMMSFSGSVAPGGKSSLTSSPNHALRKVRKPRMSHKTPSTSNTADMALISQLADYVPGVMGLR